VADLHLLAARGLQDVIRWLLGFWYARQRSIDLDILWPQCCDFAQDLDHAKAAFAAHAFHDPAWLALGERRLHDVIDKLQPP
jgi:hypothetical protein